MERVAEALKVPRLSNPTLNAIRSSIAIRDGRLHVRPVAVGIGDFQMLVSGSNGIDQSLDYTLDLAMPRNVLGDAASRALQDLAQRAGRAGFDLAADSIHVGVRVTGSITDPALDIGIGKAITSIAEQARQAAGEAVEQRVDEARERLDSARAAARQRARARADSIIGQAEERADSIRVEAARLAETVRAEGNRRADELLARATSELARLAAQPAAERIRQEADARANTLVREADQGADALVAEARRRADELVRADTLQI
jgi:vacuolar-type H+-ATPase subunit H